MFTSGVGNTKMQLQALADLQPRGYAGTPSLLHTWLERAAETGQALLSLKVASLSGEAFPPSLRDRMSARGVLAYPAYAAAVVGPVACETSARKGLVVDEGVIVEIVRRDLSTVLPGTCPTGRSKLRIKDWMGRADPSAKVRSMFVHPSQVADVLRRHPEASCVRLVVEGEMANDRVTLRAECAAVSAGLADALANGQRELTKLRAAVELLAPGSLPNDGKVVEDARSYA